MGDAPTEAEVTLAMIGAGVAALDRYRDAADDEALVRLVYIAMAERGRSGSSE